MNGKDLEKIGIVIFIILIGFAIWNNHYDKKITPTVTITTTTERTTETEIKESDNDVEITVEVLESYEDIENELYADSIELLAITVEAEAGNQSFLGKQLVADVILNRVDNPDFPNSIDEVIRQAGQFQVVSNGQIYKVVPTEETWEVVKKEMESRVNSDIIYFRTGRYSDYGEPYDQIGQHYFSTK